MKTQFSHECPVVHSSFIHQTIEATVYTSPPVVQRHFFSELLELGEKTKQNNCFKDFFHVIVQLPSTSHGKCCYFHKNTKLALKMLSVNNHYLLLCCQCFFLLTSGSAFFFQVCVLDFDSFCASARCSEG